MPDSGRLKSWSLSQGVVLANDPDGLAELDEHLLEWSADASHHEHVDLGNDVGIHLGNVIITNVAGSKWKVWPNGHPVIVLASASELDVIALVNERLKNTDSSLTQIYAVALSS